MDSDYCMVVTTFSDKDVGKRIIDGLIKKRLAACVQTANIHSVYHWKGAVNNDAEVLVLIKTKTALYAEVEAFIREQHNYEVPEIIRVPISGGFTGYLQWVDKECTGGGT